MSEALPLLVAGPLAAAALVAALHRFVPGLVLDAIALLVALACCVGSLAVAGAAREGPLVAFLGGWAPEDGAQIGIALVADVLGGGFAALIAGLVAVVIVYGRLFFGAVEGLYQALLLVVLGAGTGFALTGDLFNLYVFFELIGVTTFVLTAYRMDDDALHGALLFAVINTLASVLLLAGIGTLYAVGGSVDLSALGRALAEEGDGPAVRLGFVLVVGGFLIKAAALPFHLWLTEAYAGAPAPVCVLFGGASVTFGLFGLARVLSSVFAFGSLPEALASAILLPVGVATALAAAALALVEPNLKRILALTTIAHVGIVLVALGLADPQALGGASLYGLGHAVVKAGLFAAAGVLVAHARTSDLAALAARARDLGRGGMTSVVLLGLGALAIAGAPPGLAYRGKGAIEEAADAAGLGALGLVAEASGVMAGAAILAAALRIGLARGAPVEPPRIALPALAPGRNGLGLAIVAALLVGAGLLPSVAGLDESAARGALHALRAEDVARTVLDGAPFVASALPASAMPSADLSLRGLLPPIAAIGLACLLAWPKRHPTIAATAPARTGAIGDATALTAIGLAALGVLAALVAG